MSCKHCHDLCVTQRTTLQEGLDHLLALIHGELNAGTLREAPRRISRRAKPLPPFETLTADGPFEIDELDYEFHCQFCGEAFALRIDVPARLAEWLAVDPAQRRSGR